MPDQDAPFVAQPCECSLHDEAQSVAVRAGMLAEWRSSSAWSSIHPLRDHRDHPVSPEGLSKSPAVVGPVRQDATRTLAASPPAPASHADLGQDPFGQPQFMDVGTLKGESDRRPVPIDEDFPLGPFSDLRDSDTAAPLLAGAKLASKMPWDSFSRPRFPSWPSKTRSTRGHTPSRCQRTSRSQQVAGEPYSRGMSRQRQPALSTNRIPLMVFRSSTRGRPCRFIRGNTALIRFQSFADKSVSRMMSSDLGLDRSV